MTDSKQSAWFKGMVRVSAIKLGCAASSYGSSVVLWRWPYDWRGQVGERD